MDAASIGGFLFVVVVSGAVLLPATLGSIVTELSGATNLGVEGLMLFGAMVAYGTAFTTGDAMLGAAAGTLAGGILSLTHAIPVVYGRMTQERQLVLGLILVYLGDALSRLLGAPYISKASKALDVRWTVPYLADLPVVGEALQLTNILLDWPVDVRAGRCHVPASWLARHGLAPRDLVTPGAAARELSLRLASLAHDALDRVPDYLETVPVREHRYRLFCLLPALWARASLRQALVREDFHWAPVRPRIGRKRIVLEGLRGLLAHGSHAATRSALTVAGPRATRPD